MTINLQRSEERVSLGTTPIEAQPSSLEIWTGDVLHVAGNSSDVGVV